MDDLNHFCCLNPACEHYGKRGAGNLSVCDHYGKEGQWCLLYCSGCKVRFSERKGTVFFRSRLKSEKVVSILQHVDEGVGMRKTGRLEGVKEDTVIRYAKLAGEHAKHLHDELVRFSPATEEVQMDEKWSFVKKKEKNCLEGEAGERCGDNWDHVAFDPEHRLVLTTVPGKRSAEKVQELVADVKQRLAGRVPRLITTDEYAAYPQAILNAYSTEVVPPPTGKPGRPKAPQQVPLPELHYATVHKTRQKGRVVKVVFNIVFGLVAAVMAAVSASRVSRHINTAFIERHNGTDRNRNSRKVRKTYCFSKNWDTHEAVGYYTMYSYNFCWPVRTLGSRGEGGRWQDRTPAMAAGLTDHVWPLVEWLSRPAARRAT